MQKTKQNPKPKTFPICLPAGEKINIYWVFIKWISIYTVMRKNESDIHVGQKKQAVDMIQYNAVCYFG